MIATSTGAITEDKARTYAHDVGVLATAGYLKNVDLTLFSGTTEVRAVTYNVNTSSGDLEMSRPGGVMWPRVQSPDFRIVLWYTDAYTASCPRAVQGKAEDRLDTHQRRHQPFEV